MIEKQLNYKSFSDSINVGVKSLDGLPSNENVECSLVLSERLSGELYNFDLMRIEKGKAVTCKVGTVIYDKGMNSYKVEEGMLSAFANKNIVTDGFFDLDGFEL